MMSHASQALCFRPFAVTDAELLSDWLAAVGLGVPPSVCTETWATRLIGEPEICCRAAVSESGEVLGFLRLDIGPDQQAEVTLIVEPDIRRAGYGRQLLEESFREARARGIGKLRAVVREGNRVALSFFEREGFEEVGENTPGNIHLCRLIHRSERQPPLEI